MIDVKKIMAPLFPHFEMTQELPLYNSSIQIFFLCTNESKNQVCRYVGASFLHLYT